jgi:acetyl esterase/lipase
VSHPSPNGGGATLLAYPSASAVFLAVALASCVPEAPPAPSSAVSVPELVVVPAIHVPASTTNLFAPAADCTLPEPEAELPILSDVAYGAHPRQVYDLARPFGVRTRGLLVIVHGGGWTSGNKKLFRPLLGKLAARGYAVIATNYRLAAGSSTAFPAAVKDVRCAVRHAQAYLSKNNVHVPFAYVGASSGGHLAALATVAFDESAFDPDANCGTADLRPLGAVAYYPPTELDTAPTHYTYVPMTQAVDEFLRHGGGEPDGKHPRPRDDEWPIAAKLATPKHFVTAGDPPILFLHGTRDHVVPMADSENLAAALRAAAVPSRVIAIDEGHGFAVFGTKGNVAPATCSALGFLDHLFAAATPSPSPSAAPRNP